LIEEVHEALGLGLDVPIRWIVAVERGLDDGSRSRSILFRVLVNIARNAGQALKRVVRAIRRAIRSSHQRDGVKAAWS
jgi:hypothetical protein